MPTTAVSVNAYNDAELLDNCLASVREHLPDATVHVVDGRYSAWPDAEDNSTDATGEIAAEHGADYLRAGPFEDEAAKHRYRRDMAATTEAERVLFVDADERLLRFDPPEDPDTDHRAGIFNALVYGPAISYYPRYFAPERMTVERVDKFMLDGPVQRTDGITIVHRADLRSEAYRDAKRKRFDTEGRDPWYDDYLERLAENGHDAEFTECPNCGQHSVTTSRLTGYEPRDSGRSRVAVKGDAELGDEFSRVMCCTAGDGCYRTTETFELSEFVHLPDRVSEGFAEDLERVKLELMAAGWELAKTVPVDAFDRYEANARQWVSDEWDDMVTKT